MYLSSRASHVNLEETSSERAKLTVLLNDFFEEFKKERYEKPESFARLPFDRVITAEVENIRKHFCSSALKYVLVIGIGGSSLGAKAVYYALTGKNEKYKPEQFPRMLFAETIDAPETHALVDFLKRSVKHADEIVIAIISKSGTTTETIANAGYILEQLNYLSAIETRTVIITKKDSPLAQFGAHHNIMCAEIADAIGGRFSIFSHVGLVPLALAGIDVEKLTEGARNVSSQCISQKIERNNAAISALILYLNMQKGCVIHDIFLFNPELEHLGKWYRQLIGESLGKEYSVEGKQIFTGILPTVSIGTHDLHSVAQLYLGGPRNRFTSFLWNKPQENSIYASSATPIASIAPEIEDVSFNTLMEAVFEGTKEAYEKQGLPFMETVLPVISPYTLGQYMQWKMIETVLLGKLMGVNPFDQPQVELYKSATRKYLLTHQKE